MGNHELDSYSWRTGVSEGRLGDDYGVSIRLRYKMTTLIQIEESSLVKNDCAISFPSPMPSHVLVH